MEEKFYFRDTQKADKIQREADELVSNANMILAAYSKFGNIKTVDEFHKLIANPRAKFKADFYNANSKNFTAFVNAGIDIDPLIKVPEIFLKLETEIRGLNVTGLNEKFFKIQDGKFVLTEQFYTDKDQRTAFTATSKAERARVQFCQSLIQTLKDLQQYADGEDCDVFAAFRGFLNQEKTSAGIEYKINPEFIKSGFSKQHLVTLRFVKRQRATRVESKPRPRYWSPDKHLAEKFVSTSGNQTSM
jgi:hypothetical protein